VDGLPVKSMTGVDPAPLTTFFESRLCPECRSVNSPLLSRLGSFAVGAFVFRSWRLCNDSIRLLNEMALRSNSCFALDGNDWISAVEGLAPFPT
jgi:hypothetical protein